MFKSAAITITALLGLSLSGTSLAHESSPYIEIGIGHAIGTGDLVHSGPGSAGLPGYGLGDAVVRSLAIGYQTINNVRFEFDLRNRRIDIGDTRNIATRQQVQNIVPDPMEQFTMAGSMESQTRMLNVAYLGELIKPDWKAYLKVGAGEAKNRARASLTIQPTMGLQGIEEPIEYPRGSDREFAWSVGAGVHVHMQDNMEMGLDYQYSNLGDASTQQSDNGDLLEHEKLAVHEVSFKLRFHF